MIFLKTYRLELLMLSIPLFILIILRVLGFDGLYGQDSYEYLRYIDKIKEFYLTGTHPGDFFWPKGYPLIAGFFSLFLPSNLAAQLISVFSLLGVFIFTRNIIKHLFSSDLNINFYLLISLLISPYMLRSGIIVMSDMLAVCCLTGSFYYGLKYKKEPLFSTLFLCVLLGVFSVFTRYAAFIPVSIILISVVIIWVKNIQLSHLFVFIIPLMLIPLHFFFESRSNEFMNHEWINTWNITNFYKKSFTTIDGTQQNIFSNIIYAFFPFYHPGFFIFGGAILFFMVKELKSFLTTNFLIIGLGILSYAIFLMGIPFQNNRFLLLTYPLFLIINYPVFNRLILFFKFKKIVIGVLIFIQLALFVRVILPSCQLNILEKNITSELTHFQNQTLYCFDIDVAIKGRGLIFNYKNLWVEEYKSFEKGALVLFNEEKLKDQWEGKTPMINWDNIKDNYQIKLIKPLSGGWNLYRIE